MTNAISRQPRRYCKSRQSGSLPRPFPALLLHPLLDAHGATDSWANREIIVITTDMTYLFTATTTWPRQSLLTGSSLQRETCCLSALGRWWGCTLHHKHVSITFPHEDSVAATRHGHVVNALKCPFTGPIDWNYRLTLRCYTKYLTKRIDILFLLRLINRDIVCIQGQAHSCLHYSDVHEYQKASIDSHRIY